MAFALLLGMAQCKKEPATPNGDNNGGVRITLKVNDGDNGEKLNVYPATGAVIFTQGDKIYVGNNGKYVGTLTFDNGLFQGSINDDLCSTTDYLHFYFVGNKPTSPATLTASTTTYTVNISDQSTGLPAISYAPSTAKYSPSTTAYTAKLLNKSALVKFVPSVPTSQPITVSGLNNEVQIDFANHTLAPTGNTGNITLFSAGDSEKWAILLEQASLSGLTVSVYGYNSTIDGTTLPSAITNNMYYNSGVGISMTAAYQTFVVTSTNPETTIASFNAAASTPTPKLYFETNYGDGLTITRANGIVDFNGHSANELFIKNNVLGESITLQNGTIGPKPIDGESGTSTSFKGTVILENMTVNGRIYTDGHAYVINSGTYYLVQNDYRTGYPSTVVINGGKFREFYSTTGQYTIYGGKYSFYPSNSNNVTIPSGYSVKSNTDNDAATYPWIVSADAPVVSYPEGAINGKFTINSNGDQVYFSKGNLQYKASSNTWQFATNQYDFIGSDNSNISQNYSGWIDLFGWGTSGWSNGNVYYQPYDTQNNGNSNQGYGYGPTNGTSYTYNLTGTYANADWGVYNPISNGGNTTNTWRTLTGGSNGEWEYIFDSRSTPSGIRYAKAQVNGVSGVILLPDDWSASYYSLNNTNQNSASFGSNVISSTLWSTLEQHGAVFLPAAGYRSGSSVYNVGSDGNYWSASYSSSNYAYGVLFYDSGLNPQSSGRYSGYSVRLVRNVE